MRAVALLPGVLALDPSQFPLRLDLLQERLRLADARRRAGPIIDTQF